MISACIQHKQRTQTHPHTLKSLKLLQSVHTVGLHTPYEITTHISSFVLHLSNYQTIFLTYGFADSHKYISDQGFKKK